MRFSSLEHYDIFDDEIIFWTEITDLPQEIQDKAKIIDGKEYNANCFGVCINYDFATKKFCIVTDTDLSTGNTNNIYYIDNDGNKHWFNAEITKEFTNQLFTECNKVNVNKEVNAGYEIKESVVFTNNRGFALAYSQKENLFVTWRTTEEDGKRHYYLGRYTADENKARDDYAARIADYKEQYGVREKPRRIAEQLAEAKKQVERDAALPTTDKKQRRQER